LCSKQLNSTTYVSKSSGLGFQVTVPICIKDKKASRKFSKTHIYADKTDCCIIVFVSGKADSLWVRVCWRN